jgi:hypothetical protein
MNFKNSYCWSNHIRSNNGPTDVLEIPKAFRNLVTLKEKGDAFCLCKPLMLGIQTQCELLKSSWNKKIVTSLISTSRSL